jgi:hypothetical protein
MCKVMNARQVGKRPATDRVYVGHPSKWGNPRDTARGSCGSRRSALHELRGKNLVCLPERCHAEVLIELANR